MELAISIAEAARRLGLGRTRVYELIGEGRLKIRKCGRRSLVAVADLERFVDELPSGNFRKVG